MPQNHVRSTMLAVQAALIAAVALFGANTAQAANAVVPQSWSGNNYLAAGSTTISGSGAGLNKQGFTTNPALSFSAWAHAGHWYNFENQINGQDVWVTVTGNAGYVPGLSVWATGSSAFDGGTEGYAGETSNPGWGTPHSFNATGAQGDFGTLWMANGAGGNVLETLGYAIANPNVNYGPANTGWNETIQSGVHDVSLTNTFESGIGGSTSAQSVTLSFNDLAAGWYTLYIGGTDATALNGGYDLVVTAVPEAETWAMLLAGLGLIGWRLRNQSRPESSMMLA